MGISDADCPVHSDNIQRGHNSKTCFQPGGGIEGKQEEYLANRSTKLITHLADVEENLEAERSLYSLTP